MICWCKWCRQPRLSSWSRPLEVEEEAEEEEQQEVVGEEEEEEDGGRGGGSIRRPLPVPFSFASVSSPHSSTYDVRRI